MGGGLEYAFTNGFLGFNNVTAKIEGLYVSFDRNNRNNNGFFGGGNVVGVSNTGAAVFDSQFAGSGFDNRRNRDDFAVVRAGLNWKFNALMCTGVCVDRNLSRRREPTGRLEAKERWVRLR